MGSLSDKELRKIVRLIALRMLEVERGLRPQDTLRPLLTPDAYERLSAPDAPRHLGAGPATARDLGDIVLRRDGERHAVAIVTAREHADRWSPIVVRLRGDGRGAWRVSELDRTHGRGVADILSSTELDPPEHHATRPVPDYLSILGPRPTRDPGAEVWQHAADIIQGYRRRWTITDHPAPLGSPPTTDSQRRDRNITATRLRQAVEALRAQDMEAPARLPDDRRWKRALHAESPPEEPPVRMRANARLPLQPLLDALPIDPVLARPDVPGPGPIGQAAILLDTTRRSLHRYVHKGIPAATAERLADRAGLIPEQVWGPAWTDVFEPDSRIRSRDSREQSQGQSLD